MGFVLSETGSRSAARPRRRDPDALRAVGTRHAHARIRPSGALPPIPRLPARALLSGFRCLETGKHRHHCNSPSPSPRQPDRFGSEFTSVDLDCLKLNRMHVHTTHQGLDSAFGETLDAARKVKLTAPTFVRESWTPCTQSYSDPNINHAPCHAAQSAADPPYLRYHYQAGRPQL
jgi:hypothetical protein